MHCHGASPLSATEPLISLPPRQSQKGVLCAPYSPCAHCVELLLLYQARACELASTPLLKRSRGKSGDLATHSKGWALQAPQDEVQILGHYSLSAMPSSRIE